jgi:hypothetical protein
MRRQRQTDTAVCNGGEDLMAVMVARGELLQLKKREGKLRHQSIWINGDEKCAGAELTEEWRERWRFGEF